MVDGSATRLVPIGLFIDILDLLQEKLNFTIDCKKEVGYHEWNSMNDMMNEGSLDIVATGIRHDFERSWKMDLPQHLIESEMRIIYPKFELNTVNWYAYSGSLRFDSWIGILCYLVALVAIFFILNFLSRGTEHSFDVSDLSNSLVTAYMSVLGKSVPQEVGMKSPRLALVSVTFGGFILINAYKAMLAASFAITIDTKPFNTLEDIVNSDHKILVYPNSSNSNLLERNPEGSILRKMWLNNREFAYGDEQSVFDGIVNGTLKDRLPLAYMLLASQSPHWPCRLDALNLNLKTAYIGIGFRRDWPYTSLMNYYLGKIKESGKFDKLKRNYFRSSRMICHQQRVSPIDCNVCFTALLVMLIGMCSSFVVLIGEWKIVVRYL